MDRVFEVSTPFGLACLAAGVEEGLFGDRADGRRVLLVSDNAIIPEAVESLVDWPGFRELADAFDSVDSWNDIVHPYHPHQWEPRFEDWVVWERFFKQRLGLDEGPCEVVVESFQAGPARALTMVLPNADISVYADGLMSYGPTRRTPPVDLARRIRRVVLLPLFPELDPLLFMEQSPEYAYIPADAFRRSVQRSSTPADVDWHGGEARRPLGVVLGQTFSELGFLSPSEELDLYRAMLGHAVGQGMASVLFKPHPTSLQNIARRVAGWSDELGIPIGIGVDRNLVETTYAEYRPDLVIGCFSTALATARQVYGLRVLRVGTGEVLSRLPRLEDSNRVPLALVDALLPGFSSATAQEPDRQLSVDEARLLLRGVGHAMQPDLLPQFADDERRVREGQVDGAFRSYLPVDESVDAAHPVRERVKQWVRGRKRLYPVAAPAYRAAREIREALRSPP